MSNGRLLPALLLCALCAASAPLARETSAAPQQPPQQQSPNYDRSRNEEIRNEQIRREQTRIYRSAAADARLRARRTNKASPSDPLVLREEMLTPEERRLLEPSAADRAQYAQLLKERDTGLCKLLPGKSASAVVSIGDLAGDKPALTLHGGGAFFSFTKRRHDADEWAEIKLENGHLVAGFAGFALGAMTVLGSIPLEAATIESAGARALDVLRPPAEFEDARRLHARYAEGINEGGYVYKSVLPVYDGQVYVLRATNYKRADSLVAFKIVRAEQDGSLTIAWKRLARYATPSLKNAPKEDKRSLSQ